LLDDDVIEDYRIEDGHTVHMVARPADYDELRQRSSEVEAASSASTGAAGASAPSSRDSTLQTLLALSALSGDPLLGGAGRGQNADLAPTSEPESEGQSLEAIRQGLLTTYTSLSQLGHDSHALGPDQLLRVDWERDVSVEEQMAKRTFYLGQWLDVKETVNQWLEVYCDTHICTTACNEGII
jgi:hypothetical protein